MSSVKRRKTDEKRPSGLLEITKKDKKVIAETAPAESESEFESEQEEQKTIQADDEAETEVEKSFKELVSRCYLVKRGSTLTKTRELLTRYATPVLPLDIKPPHRSKLNRYH